jgi:hypothetical protein
VISEPDTGAADPALLAALENADEELIRSVLPTARLLVAVVALPGAEHASEGEMVLALLEAPDGNQALPAFTSLTALTTWRSDARPVPRPAAEVMAYAQAESLAAIVLDPGTPHSWTLWRSDLQAPAPAYRPPAWRVSRRARRAAADQVVYALELATGEPVIAVVCPAGTLDADWARRLLAHCPEGTSILPVTPEGRHTVAEIGVRL